MTVERMILRVVNDGVVEGELHIRGKLLNNSILILVELLFDAIEAHWLLHNVEIVLDTIPHRIHGLPERPSLVVLFDTLEHLATVLLPSVRIRSTKLLSLLVCLCGDRIPEFVG